MSEALIGLAGIVVGVLLGGIGKYFTQRRDAWARARTSGLLLLADVRTLLAAGPTDPVVAETAVGINSWKAHRETLAGFRRGTFPSGLRAPEWLALAECFAHLERLRAARDKDRGVEEWKKATEQLQRAEKLLNRFENDPPVVPYVVRRSLRLGPPE